MLAGTGISMSATEAHQACYRQPDSQARGKGLPLARMMAAICLATGAVLPAGIAAHDGRGGDEPSLRNIARTEIMLHGRSRGRKNKRHSSQSPGPCAEPAQPG